MTKREEIIILSAKRNAIATTEQATKINLSSTFYMGKIALTTPTSAAPSSRTQKNSKKSARKMAAIARAHKQEIHTIMEFSRQAIDLAKTAIKNEEEELRSFDDLSISTTSMSA